MEIQVLVAAMNQVDHSLIHKMNIQTGAIVGNQCNYNSIIEFENNHHKIIYLNFAERGVGLNRNNTLIRADADICLLADDDMCFVDGYEQIVRDAFEKYQYADVIIFNIGQGGNGRRTNKRVRKISCLNYMNYGAARIAFRRKSITYAGIAFNLNFGGGSVHQAGEDTLFLRECIRKRLNIITVPQIIANLNDDRQSTWFSGYDKKYFFDKGTLLAVAHPRYGMGIALYMAIRHKKRFESGLGIKDAFFEMYRGYMFVKRRTYLK